MKLRISISCSISNRYPHAEHGDRKKRWYLLLMKVRRTSPIFRILWKLLIKVLYALLLVAKLQLHNTPLDVQIPNISNSTQIEKKSWGQYAPIEAPRSWSFVVRKGHIMWKSTTHYYFFRCNSIKHRSHYHLSYVYRHFVGSDYSETCYLCL